MIKDSIISKLVENIIFVINVFLTASVLSGSLIIFANETLNTYANILLTPLIFAMLLKLFSFRMSINYNVNKIKLILLIFLLIIFALLLNLRKLFNCSADLGWHIFYTFAIRSLDINLLNTILSPYQYSTFLYPGVYFITNIFYPFNFNIFNLFYINVYFNTLLFLFYILIAFTISLFSYRISNERQGSFTITYFTYILLNIPSDYVLRGNLADLMGFFYSYSSLYYYIFGNIKHKTYHLILTLYTAIFIHPYSFLFLAVVYMVIVFYYILRQRISLNFAHIFFILLLIFIAYNIHPLLNFNKISSIFSNNDWRSYVLPLSPVAYQLDYLMKTRLLFIPDILLSSFILVILVIFILYHRECRVLSNKLLLMFYLPFYMFYFLPYFNIQIEPHRFLWRSFDFIPLYFTLSVLCLKTIYSIRVTSKRLLIVLINIIIVLIYDILIILHSNVIIDYSKINVCFSDAPKRINEIINIIEFLKNSSNYNIFIFAESVPDCTYFSLIMLLNPQIKVYPLSYFATYVLRGEMKYSLDHLYKNYIQCNILNNSIYIYSQSFNCINIDKYYIKNYTYFTIIKELIK